MAKIGYARVSSKEQNLDRQLQALQGVSKVFSDKLSGQSVERPQLQAMLNYIREGDIVVVTDIDMRLYSFFATCEECSFFPIKKAAQKSSLLYRFSFGACHPPDPYVPDLYRV